MSANPPITASRPAFPPAWKRAGIVVVLFAFGIVAFVSAWEFIAGDRRVANSATPMHSVNRIHALGRLEPRATVLRISAPSGNEGARIEQLLVEEGDDVEAGALLAVLDVADRRQTAVREAAARVSAAEAKLDQIRAGAKPGEIAAQSAQVARMDAELESARKELDRARQLTQQKVLAVESLEQKQLTCDRAEAECQRARALLDSLKEVRAVDLRLQEMEVAVARATLDRAQAELNAARVLSPISGRVLKIHTHPGERIGDHGILQLGDVVRMQAVAEVFEGDVQKLRVGQPATVRVASDGRQLTGRIAQIGLMIARKDVLSNDPVSDTDARVLEVRITLADADIPRVERLSNARVEVTITLTDSEPATIITPQGN